MSETTKTPRAHAEMAAKYMADDSLQCWCWDDDTKRWFSNTYPAWLDRCFYYIGHEKPTAPPKRRVTMAGITFDAPETEAPKMGARYRLANVESTVEFAWNGNLIDQQWLAAGLIHLDRENARLHAQALRELNRQLCGVEDRHD